MPSAATIVAEMHHARKLLTSRYVSFHRDQINGLIGRPHLTWQLRGRAVLV